MSNIVALKSRPEQDTERCEKPSITLFMQLRQTFLIANVPLKSAQNA